MLLGFSLHVIFDQDVWALAEINTLTKEEI